MDKLIKEIQRYTHNNKRYFRLMETPINNTLWRAGIAYIENDIWNTLADGNTPRQAMRKLLKTLREK